MNSVMKKVGISVSVAVLTAFMLAGEGFAQDPNFYIFLAFGQSNMEGFPGVEAQDKTGVDPRFQLLYSADADGSRTKGKWVTAIPPLCRSSTGLCPVDYFGRTLVDSLPSNIKIGVINVSVAGCAIETFDKDKCKNYFDNLPSSAKYIKDYAVDFYGGNPFTRLVEMGKLAQKDGVIKGILFHQGESGSSTGKWADEVKIIYDGLVKDLGLEASKTPFLAGDLLNSSSNVKDLPKTLPTAYVISSQGLPGRDQFHFTAQGYRDFGKRYAAKMLEILKTQATTTHEVSNISDRKTGFFLGNIMDVRNGIASMSFEIPQSSFVTLKAFTLSGREIAILANTTYPAGKHTLQFSQKALHTGVFVVKMTAGKFSASQAVMAGVQ